MRSLKKNQNIKQTSHFLRVMNLMHRISPIKVYFLSKKRLKNHDFQKVESVIGPNIYATFSRVTLKKIEGQKRKYKHKQKKYLYD